MCERDHASALGEAPSVRPRPYSPRYRRVLKHPKPTILRASLRSYKERSRHLCKVMGALIPRAQRRSRYERKRPLGRSVTECVRKGMGGGGFPYRKDRGTYSSISVEVSFSSSEGESTPKGDEGDTLCGDRFIDMHKKRPFSVHILRDVYRKRPFLVHIPLSSLCVEWGGECGESPVARRKRGDYGGRFRGWERRSRSWRGCGRSPCSSPWRSDSRPQGESYSYSHRCPS